MSTYKLPNRLVDGELFFACRDIMLCMFSFSRVHRLLLIHTLERFGFWGLRSLLVLFLIEPVLHGGLGWQEAEAVAWNGLYSALLYVTPAFGGLLADRWSGGRRAIIAGLLLMSIGIASLVLAEQWLLWPSLLFLSLGNGLFKPCVTALLGRLFDPDDPNREPAYQYLYQTVLIGVLGSGFICGWLQQAYGFPIAFGFAALATFTAMLLFVGEEWPEASEIREEEAKESDGGDLRVIALLVFITVIFFSAHAQGGGLMTVFIHNYTERALFGWELPTLWLTTAGTFFGIVFTPFLARLWNKMGDNQPSFMGKLAIGMSATGLSFLIMMGANIARNWQGAHLASVYWLLGYHFTYIMGKLLVTPVLWSTAERLSPAKHRFLVMGVMMGAISIGYILGGQVGLLIGQWTFVQIFAALGVACLLVSFFLSSIRTLVINKN